MDGRAKPSTSPTAFSQWLPPAGKSKGAFCHFDRSEAQHHVVEKSGLERRGQSNCRADFSTTLRSGRNDRDSAVLRLK